MSEEVSMAKLRELHNKLSAASKAADDMREHDRRAKIVESLKSNNRLYAAYQWILKWKEDESSHDLRSRYELGAFCRQIIQDEEENNGSLYGLNAFGRLSEVFSQDKSVLQAAVRFANAYTPDQLETLCSLRRQDDEPISWSHVRWLLTIPQPAVREDMLMRLLKECWPSDVFGKECAKVLKGPEAERRPGGRKIAAPKNIKGLLDQVGTFTDKINKRAAIWTDPESSPAAMVLDMPPAQVDDSLVKDLISKRNACEESIQNLSMTKRELDKAIARAQRALEKKMDQGKAKAMKRLQDFDTEEDDGTPQSELVGNEAD
jgi:hypothetical protein